METWAIAVIVGLVLVFVLAYNALVGRRNQVDNAFSAIDVVLKKRFDLIPALVATVKQYAAHEQDTLSALTQLRARAGQAGPDERVQLENQLSQALSRVMLVAENYPQLRASENFQQLQRALNEVEEQLSAARRAYNASVTDYNNAIQKVPTNVVAAMFHHRPREVFTADVQERKAPDVGALFGS